MLALQKIQISPPRRRNFNCYHGPRFAKKFGIMLPPWFNIKKIEIYNIVYKSKYTLRIVYPIAIIICSPSSRYKSQTRKDKLKGSLKQES